MIRIKSLRPCKLIIPDAGLNLSPGQVVAVNSLSPQTQDLIARGYLVRVEDSSAATVTQNNEPENQAGGNSDVSVRTDYDSLHAPEAIEYVMGLSDQRILQAILKEEKRKTIIDAITQRLTELGK